MKNLILAIFLILPASFFAQENVVVWGKVTNPKARNVSIEIYGHNIWKPEIICSSQLNDDNSFEFKFALNELKKAYFYQGEEMSTIALEPGDSIYITLDANQFDETIRSSGKGSEKINYLLQKFLKFESHNILMVQNYIAEEPVFTNILSECKNLQLKHWNNTKNKRNFSNEFILFEETELKYFFASFKMSYPGIHEFYTQEKAKIPNNYFTFLDSLEINNDSLLTSMAYISFLRDYKQYIRAQIWNHNKLLNYKVDPYYLNKTIYKGKILDCALMNTIIGLIDHLSYKDVVKYYQDFKHSCTNQLYNDMVKGAIAKKSTIAEGNVAPNFTLKNVKGKDISLADFKGKVVYIDFWATWCSPCIMEMPKAKEIAKGFEGEDIVFIYISIDENLEQWKNYVAAHKLHGIHLNIPEGKKGKTTKDFMVDGIPSYFILDKEGKFYSSPAPHPSAKELLIKTLKEAIDKEY